ncbi:MAG: hypothetical protein ACW99A_23210 [Candidatus Kariarchaeaceae archaeon]|jgi:hypothetical protein
MNKKFLREELLWLSSSLLLFLVALLILGSPGFIELIIITITFAFTWFIVSINIKRFGVGGTDSESLKKELRWYTSLLVIFLIILLIIGSPSYSELALVTIVYSFIWLTRSFLVKILSSNNNQN